MHFINKVIQKIIDKFKIQHSLFSLYHLQNNGLVKHFNQTLYKRLVKI